MIELFLVGFLGLGLSGCAHAKERVTVMPYPWGDVTFAPQDRVDKACRRPWSKTDDGRPIKADFVFDGCVTGWTLVPKDGCEMDMEHPVASECVQCHAIVSNECPIAAMHEQAHCHGVAQPSPLYDLPCGRIEFPAVKALHTSNEIR